MDKSYLNFTDIIMIRNDNIGIEIKKITKLKNNIDIIKDFFRRHKNKAFRSVELVKKFNWMNKNTVRSGVVTLYNMGYLDKKQVSQNKTYYFWNRKNERK